MFSAIANQPENCVMILRRTTNQEQYFSTGVSYYVTAILRSDSLATLCKATTRTNMAALTLGILSLLFLFVIAFSLQVDGKKSSCDVFLVWMIMESKPKLFVFFPACSQNSVKDSTWQDRLVDWWLSVRKFGASLVIGGMGLSWLIVKLQGKQTVNNKEVGEEKLGKVCYKN